MKNFRKKALPAVAALAIASMTLGSVTYAWFTTNANVEVDSIDVNVIETDGGIAVANTANGAYTNKVSFGTDFKDTEISPVSTNGVLNASGELDFYKGVVDDDDPTYLESAAKATDGYLQFNIYFENQNSKAQDVYFNYSDVDDMFSAKQLSTESLRLAFVNMGYVTPKPVNEAGTGWAGTKTITLVEPNAQTHLTSLSNYYTGKQVYYGIQDEFDGSTDDANRQLILPTADNTYLKKVITNEVEHHNGKAAAVKFKDTDTDLAANGFVQITHYTDADASKNGWYLQESVKKVVDTPAVLYADADFDTATYTKVGDKWYVTTSLCYYAAAGTEGQADYVAAHYDVYENPQAGQNQLAPNQVGQVKTAEVSHYELYDATADAAAMTAANLTADTINQKPADVVRTPAHEALFQLPASSYSWIQVYVWMEGQDIDCSSTVSDLDFALQLNFTAVPVTPAA